MTNLLKKSTKSLTYIKHIPISFDPQTLINIIKKYDLDFKILSVHPQTCSASYIKPKNDVRIQFSQKQKLDYKLYSAIYEIYLNENPKYYLDPEYPSHFMPFNPYITTRNPKLKQQLLEIFHSLRDEYIKKFNLN